MGATGPLKLVDDDVLVAEIGDGSREAFAELYQRHFRELYDFATLEDRGSVDPSTLLIEKEITELVWTTASSLSPQDYALLDLHVRRQLEPEELAEELGVSPGALYTRMSRLRRTFEDALST